MKNPFFKNTGPHNINSLLKTINLKNYNLPDDVITDIKDLNSSQKNEITFFHSKRYGDLARKTKASYCLTSKNFQSFLPNNCKAIISDKVLLHTAQLTKGGLCHSQRFYSFSDFAHLEPIHEYKHQRMAYTL